MKNLIAALLLLLMTACNSATQGEADSTSNVETPKGGETARDGGTDKGDSDNEDETSNPSPSPTPSPTPTPSSPEFCILEELRTNFSTPIPHSGSALYVALVHDGYTNRKANPMCLLNRAVVAGDYTHIPCAVNIAEGELYGRTWAANDRPWISDALESEALLQGLAQSEFELAIENNVQSGSVFENDAALLGKNLVRLTIKTSDVEFNGYCQ